MKIKDIVKQHGLDQAEFEQFLAQKGFISFLFNRSIPDNQVDGVMDVYFGRAEQIEEEEKRKKIQELEEIRKRNQELSKILISSGFSFEGYSIKKYSGYISGDDAVEIPRGGIFGNNHGQNLTDALVKIRRKALQELKEAAYDLGCNAIIGVDFDYLTLEPETVNLAGGTRYEPYVICVTANGNAVIIEKMNNYME